MSNFPSKQQQPFSPRHSQITSAGLFDVRRQMEPFYGTSEKTLGPDKPYN